MARSEEFGAGMRRYPEDYCLAVKGAAGACILPPGHEGRGVQHRDAHGYRFEGGQRQSPMPASLPHSRPYDEPGVDAHRVRPEDTLHHIDSVLGYVRD